MSAICRFIHAEKANYPITLLCKALKTARSVNGLRVGGRTGSPRSAAAGR